MTCPEGTQLRNAYHRILAEPHADGEALADQLTRMGKACLEWIHHKEICSDCAEEYIFLTGHNDDSLLSRS